MLGIKKLDIYIIKSFLSYFAMTFFISILVLLMQFTWKQLPDLIGKGITLDIIVEFFWYASLQLIPMSLPLAILLAALMSFGNLGEHFELTAMKSAGVSLFKIMRGLIVFIATIAIAAFFFSNHVLPVAQQKLWTLVFSLRHKSPEFDIPEGEFYKRINGYNLYVREKDTDKKLLKDLMIYDFSEGFERATVMLADSGKIQFTADKKYLKLILYDGESFENLRNNSFNTRASNIPYRREMFVQKEMLLDFDSEFNRYDESILKDHNISKNLAQLNYTIDSVSIIAEKRAQEQGLEMINSQYQPMKRAFSEGSQIEIEEVALNTDKGIDEKQTSDEEKLKQTSETTENKKNFVYHNYDSLFRSLNKEEMESALSVAIRNSNEVKSQIEYNKIMLDNPTMEVRRHQIEWHRKFTLSLACLIFFFIGAPLGAIIRKGGIGLPIVVSVILFIIYYMIDTTGNKLAREGLWEAYQGMWLSSAILLPLGIFLTWKAVTDASLFRAESYQKIIENIKEKTTNIKDSFGSFLIKRNKPKTA